MLFFQALNLGTLELRDFRLWSSQLSGVKGILGFRDEGLRVRQSRIRFIR